MSISKKAIGMGAALALTAAGLAGTVTTVSAGEGASANLEDMMMSGTPSSGEPKPTITTLCVCCGKAKEDAEHAKAEAAVSRAISEFIRKDFHTVAADLDEPAPHLKLLTGAIKLCQEVLDVRLRVMGPEDPHRHEIEQK